MLNVNKINQMNAAGINTHNFFDVNVTGIPVGSNVQILVDGKPYNVNENKGVEKRTTVCLDEFNEIETPDEVVSEIEEKGWINNAKLFRRWIMALTMKMMFQKTYNYEKSCYEYGYDAYLRNRYGYMYQFDMLVNELHTLATLEKKDYEAFCERINFFNKGVVIDTCEHYFRKLSENIRKQPKRMHCRKPYVVVYRPYKEYVYQEDLYKEIYNPLYDLLWKIRRSSNYSDIETYFKEFRKIMPKLPWGTPKCSVWKDAFKGAGGYYSLKNGIMFHNFDLINALNIEETDFSYNFNKDTRTNRNLNYIKSLLIDWGCTNEVWRFQKVFEEYVKKTNFNLSLSIIQNSKNK